MGSQIIVELDSAMARELDAIAPSRARKRSEFVRRALRAALDRAAEDRMREAYRRLPDDEPTYFDPAAWDAPLKGSARRARSRRT
jgi:Arc/MetJ-type ribon-helix-helix transcriptional regulator